MFSESKRAKTSKNSTFFGLDQPFQRICYDSKDFSVEVMKARNNKRLVIWTTNLCNSHNMDLRQFKDYDRSITSRMYNANMGSVDACDYVVKPLVDNGQKITNGQLHVFDSVWA